MTNTLAYDRKELITILESFIVQAIGVSLTKFYVTDRGAKIT